MHADAPQELQEAKVAAKTRVRLWARRKGGDDVIAKAPKKRERAKAFTTAVTWNNIWKQCTGEGLLQLSTLDEEGVERPAKRWKCGHVSPDMGSNNVACVSYLQYGPLHLNLDVTYDFSHGAYNDVKGMEKDVGLWPSVLMLTTAYNCRYGSDLSPNRLKQIRESFFEYMLKADPQTCPLYNGYLQIS